jgi:hypothetical protein
MLLFVVHSTFMVLWSYRYAGIDVQMKLVFGLELNLFSIWYGQRCRIASSLLGHGIGRSLQWRYRAQTHAPS